MRDIVYACNDNYVRQTLVSIVSLMETNHYPIKVWIISDKIMQENKEYIRNKTCTFHMKLEFVELETVLGGVFLSEGERHPKTIYAKLFLENIIESDKILYLDSDTVVNSDLEELWKRDMSEEFVAGVKMPYSSKKKSLLNLPSTVNYLCDGIIMINLQEWRKNEIGKKCKAYIQHYRGRPPMLSEGTLNYVCQQKIGILAPGYNVMPFMIMYSSKEIEKLFMVSNYYNDEDIQLAKEYPIIIHFIKELFNRPWFEPCDHPYKNRFRCKYERLFGEKHYEHRPLGFHTKITRLLLGILPFRIFVFLYQIRERTRKTP